MDECFPSKRHDVFRLIFIGQQYHAGDLIVAVSRMKDVPLSVSGMPQRFRQCFEEATGRTKQKPIVQTDLSDSLATFRMSSFMTDRAKCRGVS